MTAHNSEIVFFKDEEHVTEKQLQVNYWLPETSYSSVYANISQKGVCGAI